MYVCMYVCVYVRMYVVFAKIIFQRFFIGPVFTKFYGVMYGFAGFDHVVGRAPFSIYFAGFFHTFSQEYT